MPGATHDDDQVEVPDIMRALDPEVFDAVWAAIEPLLPTQAESHPLGCHRPGIPDRVCFRGILIRLVTGCSWQDSERLLDNTVSDTTLRARRDEWLAAGVFDLVVTEAIGSYDRIIDGTSARSPSTAANTKPPAAAKGPARTQPTEDAQAGNGRWPPTPPESHWPGSRCPPTPTTAPGWPPPSTP
jgi:transposase